MKRHLKSWLLALAIACIAVLAVGNYFAKSLLFVENRSSQADAVVILGGDVGDRAFRGLEVFKSNAVDRVVISGAGDCYLIRDRLLLAGVPKEKLHIEDNSKNTKENAEFSLRLLRKCGCKKVIIVTSWYHSRRALACFRHFDKDIEFYSIPAYNGVDMKRKPGHGETALVFHEYLGLLWYAMRYGITS